MNKNFVKILCLAIAGIMIITFVAGSVISFL